jgi:hypothetical protein
MLTEMGDDASDIIQIVAQLSKPTNDLERLLKRIYGHCLRSEREASSLSGSEKTLSPIQPRN